MADKQDETDDIARILGENLRTARAASGMLQEDVARAVDMSAEYYSRVESGEQVCTVEKLIAIADVLGVSVDQLLGEAITPRRLSLLDRLPDKLRWLAESAIARGQDGIKFMSRLLIYCAKHLPKRAKPGSDEPDSE